MRIKKNKKQPQKRTKSIGLGSLLVSFYKGTLTLITLTCAIPTLWYTCTQVQLLWCSLSVLGLMLFLSLLPRGSWERHYGSFNILLPVLLHVHFMGCGIEELGALVLLHFFASSLANINSAPPSALQIDLMALVFTFMPLVLTIALLFYDANFSLTYHLNFSTT